MQVFILQFLVGGFTHSGLWGTKTNVLGDHGGGEGGRDGGQSEGWRFVEFTNKSEAKGCRKAASQLQGSEMLQWISQNSGRGVGDVESWGSSEGTSGVPEAGGGGSDFLSPYNGKSCFNTALTGRGSAGQTGRVCKG